MENVASTDGWSPVSVPNAYNAGDFSNASMSGYVGWYRRDFTLPSGAFARYVAARDRHWIIRFESINYRATVWLNGHLIGTHTGAYLPFEFDMTPQLHAGVNRLIVRVDDTRGPSDLPPGPGGGWWNFGGILREVYLRTVQGADLQQVQVRPILPCPSCAADDPGAGLGPQPDRGRRSGSVCTGTTGTSRSTSAARRSRPHAPGRHRPRCWSIVRSCGRRGIRACTAPRLTLSDSRGRALGGYVTYSGIRSIVVNANGQLTLNGRLLHLRGAFIHEQNLQTGAALTPAQLATLIGWAQQARRDRDPLALPA